MISKTPSRSYEDIDEVVLSYAEIKALATGNPLIKEKMDLDIGVSKLKILKDSLLHEIYNMEDKLLKHIPRNISYLEKNIKKYEEAIEKIKNYEMESGSDFKMIVNNSSFTERVDAGIVVRISNLMNSLPAKLENTISSLAETRDEKCISAIVIRRNFRLETATLIIYCN